MSEQKKRLKRSASVKCIIPYCSQAGTFTGKVVNFGSSLVWVDLERQNGKFLPKERRMTVCIPKRAIVKVIK